jgi:hypothetical protein
MSVGLDIYINEAMTRFSELLWVGSNNNFAGRSYRVRKDGRLQPEIYDTNREYKESLFTDKYDSVVHVDIDPSNPLIGFDRSLTNANVFFAVNLKKVYGNDTEREVERAKSDIVNALRYTAFRYETYVDQLPAYTDVYDMADDDLHKYNMQPYYVVRFECVVNAGIGDCEPTPQVIKRPVTIAIDGDGVTSPEPGSYQIENGTTQQLIAAPNPGNEFDRWEITGESNPITTPVYNLLVDGAKNATAFFNVALQTFLKIFNQAPVQFGDSFGYLNEINTLSNYDLNVLVYANSIGAQSGFDAAYRWVYKLKYYLQKYPNISVVTVNASTNGITGATLLANYATDLQPNYDPTKRNIVIGFEVINDLGAGATDQECYEHLRDISALVQGDGHEFVLATALNTTRTANNENTRIPIINQICKDNPTDWNSIWDMNAIPELVDPTDTDYFGDGTHPTQLGAEQQAIKGAEFIAVDYLQLSTDNTIVNKTSILNLNEGSSRIQFPRSASWDFGADSFTCFAKFRMKDIVSEPQAAGVIAWRDADALHHFTLQANYVGDGTISIQNRLAAEDGTQFLSVPYINNKDKIIPVVVVVDRNNDEMINYFQLLKRTKDITGISGSVTPTTKDMYVGARDFGGTTGNIDLFHVALISGVPTQQQIDEYLYQDQFNISNPAFNLEFEHQGGTEVLDSGTDKLTGTILNDSFSTWIQENNIEPKSLTKGCTVYYDGVSEYRIVNYDSSGNSQNRTIAGFTKVGDFPANSGFLIGLLNTVDYPDTTQVNDYLTAKGITRTNQTFDDIKGYTTDETLIRSSNANQITNLEFKE